jgi:rhomboid family GlyGly-CTERM serine protease
VNGSHRGGVIRTGPPQGLGAVDAQAWVALSALLAVLGLMGYALAPSAWEWQPVAAATQWWRWWSPVAVHLSALHLAANLAGAVAVGALGWAAAVPARVALAWFVAWPLTHMGLWLRADLLHYGGLSGVLHAGVACAGLHLVMRSGRHRERWIGAAVLAVLVSKVLLETPWGPPARAVDGWDIAVAPLGHATGVVAGLMCAAVVELMARARRRRAAAPGDSAP